MAAFELSGEFGLVLLNTFILRDGILLRHASFRDFSIRPSSSGDASSRSIGFCVSGWCLLSGRILSAQAPEEQAFRSRMAASSKDRKMPLIIMQWMQFQLKYVHFILIMCNLH